MRDMDRTIRGVLFDLGGVILDSPLEAIARYEQDHGIEPTAINRAVVAAGEAGAWSRLERGELAVEDFCAPFEADCRGAGIVVDGARLMTYIAGASVVRPRMVEAVRQLRAAGVRVGALTNNWKRRDPSPDGHRLREHFDVMIESSVVGLRKPDPKIYELACRELGVEPAHTAFLDDIGLNLKSARALGMTTIKVDHPDEALRELGAVVGIDLLG
jgi:putative hydrolase of the HAD superfamily